MKAALIKTNRKTCLSRWIVGAVFAAWLFSGRASAAAPPAERMDLPNHLIVVVSEEHSLPFVTLYLLVDAGAWRDPVSKAGLANLAAESLLLGTAHRPISEINEALDFMGSGLDVSCRQDYAVLSLKSLKKKLDPSFDLFMDILSEPAFPAAEVRREKEKILGEIEAKRDNPGERAGQAFRKALFLSGPYDHPVEGARESLTALDPAAALDFYRKHYRPNASVLAVVGDITFQEVKDKLAPRLAKWPKAELPERPVKTRFAVGPKTVEKNLAISQANIVLGHGGIQRSNPDYYAVSVMNRILGGGGFSSRLMEAIRIQRGLAYSVYSSFSARKFPGAFRIVLQTKNSSATEAIDLAVKEMKRLQREMVSEKELATAQKYLVGSFPMRLETQSGLASFLAQAVYYGLGLDYPEKYPSLIQSVSREDVLAAARKYLHPDECVLSIVGNVKEIGEARNAAEAP